jgi:hypothetical protein
LNGPPRNVHRLITHKRGGVDDFETWLSAQGITADSVTPEQLALLRQAFGEAGQQAANWRAQPAPSGSSRKSDRRYAVAIEDGGELGLTFWIKRSAKDEIFLFYPRDPEMDPHASYHRDGTYHQKSHGLAMSPQKRQALDSSFRGAEHLGRFSGHGAGPRINDPSAFDDVLVVSPDVLSGKRGCVVVDLIEPGGRPAPHHREQMRIVDERIYQDSSPWIVVAIAGSPDELPKSGDVRKNDA